MNKQYYTKLFMKQLGEKIHWKLVNKKIPLWWRNPRDKDVGGLRLTDEGLALIQQLNFATYKIDFPKNFKISTQVLLHLDQLLDCPYYLADKYIVVTSERKAVELTLFSGDVRLYGCAKAMTRDRKAAEDENN